MKVMKKLLLFLFLSTSIKANSEPWIVKKDYISEATKNSTSMALF